MRDIYYRVFTKNNNIYFQYQLDKTWSTPEFIGSGRYPCIALGPTGGTPWVLWYSRGVYMCGVRRPNGTWNTRAIFGAEEEPIEEWSVGPSMVMATPSMEQLGDLAYAVISDRYERIRFIPFDTVRNYCKEIIIDEHSPCLAPSISITPADLLHIVWQRDEPGDGKIFYKTTLEKVIPENIRQDIPPNWSNEVRISTELPYWQTEPASNPSTEAYGDSVFAVWRGPNEEGNPEYGDIWRRSRWLRNNPEEWELPRNKSETPLNESNYPVMSTDFVTVWHEQVDTTNWDIWGRFEKEPSAQPFFQTEKTSKYPQIHGFWDKEIAQFFCYTIWTEEIEHPLYEVRFGRKKWIPSAEDKDRVALYYTVEIGDDSASPYCLERDGYLTQGSYSSDYADEDLKYKLPYLNPNYLYDLRAIVYRTGSGNWLEEFYTDSVLTATVLFEPNQPETIWIRLPEGSYDDTEVLKEIEKVIGRRAIIADLRLYQVEVFDDSTGGGPQSAGSSLIQRQILYQSYPNPFKSRTVIRYSIPVECKVSLSVYDISGRLIKTLINQPQTSGVYSINWDGKDERGRTLSQGVYFYRLKTDRFSDTRRLILIR